MKHIAIIASAIIGTALAATSPALAAAAKTKCVRAGGAANMVTEDLAKFMANAALKNSIAAHNWKASGPVAMKCESAPVGLTFCKATQKACG